MTAIDGVLLLLAIMAVSGWTLHTRLLRRALTEAHAEIDAARLADATPVSICNSDDRIQHAITGKLVGTASKMHKLVVLRRAVEAMSAGAYSYEDNTGDIVAPSAGPNRFLPTTVCQMYITNHRANATGLCALRNSATALLDIADAAMLVITTQDRDDIPDDAWPPANASAHSSLRDALAELEAP